MLERFENIVWRQMRWLFPLFIVLVSARRWLILIFDKYKWTQIPVLFLIYFLLFVISFFALLRLFHGLLGSDPVVFPGGKIQNRFIKFLAIVLVLFLLGGPVLMLYFYFSYI